VHFLILEEIELRLYNLILNTYHRINLSVKIGVETVVSIVIGKAFTLYIEKHIYTYIQKWKRWMVTSNMDNIFEVMSEVSFFCESDDLSMPALKKHISQLISKLPRHIIKDYNKFRPFFHNVCMNERVTMEMIQYLLFLFPYVCEIKDEKSADETYAYPLHFCCYNQHCSSEIIKLIMEKKTRSIKNLVCNRA